MNLLLSKFRSLSHSQQVLLCVSPVLLLSSQVLLSLSKLEQTRWIVARLVTVLPPYTSVDDPDHITWAVRCANAFLPGNQTCLANAIVSEALFAAHGYRVTVRLGVGGPPGEFQAHAWVEREGAIAIGDLPELDQYQILSSWEVKP